jgi:hypothetical protein
LRGRFSCFSAFAWNKPRKYGSIYVPAPRRSPEGLGTRLAQGLDLHAADCCWLLLKKSNRKFIAM